MIKQKQYTLEELNKRFSDENIKLIAELAKVNNIDASEIIIPHCSNIPIRIHEYKNND